MKWTENNILNLENKIVLITGANSGIGYEKARLFCKYGASVIMGVRSIERGTDAKTKILSEFKDSNIDVFQLDLGDFESIKNFSDEVHSHYQKIDILVNNAGIMTTPYEPTKQGFESQIGVNHLGHFYLTSLLLDLVKASEEARIINTSSIAHQFGKINVDSFHYKEGGKYNKSLAYSQSKLSNLLFTRKLDRLVKEHNLKITVVATHPGISKTNLGRHLRNRPIANFLMWTMGIVRQNAYMGSLPCMYASVEDIKGGEYIGPRGLFHTKGYPKLNRSSKRSKNTNLQDILWDESIIYTKAKYDFT